MSSNVCRPIFFAVEPQSTGIISPLITPFLSPICTSSDVNSSPEKYLSSNASSVSATASISIALTFSTSACKSCGISTVTHSLPLYCLANRSTTFIKPLKFSAFPHGKWKGATFLPYLSFNSSNILS